MAAEKSPICFERFESTRSGFFTAGRESRMIAYAQTEAWTWMNENPHIEVISINTTATNMLASVTVWYRERQPDSEPSET